jgi:hypothetical protein
MIETYTFKVSYAPFNDDNLNTQLTNLSIEHNDKTIVQFSQSEADFRKATVKILRTLCIMTQTLKVISTLHSSNETHFPHLSSRRCQEKSILL